MIFPGGVGVFLLAVWPSEALTDSFLGSLGEIAGLAIVLAVVLGGLSLLNGPRRGKK